MRKARTTLLLGLVAALAAGAAFAQVDFSRYVALGDSYCAGYVQPVTAAEATKLNSYPAILARQIGSSGTFQQPLISEPGIPAELAAHGSQRGGRQRRAHHRAEEHGRPACRSTSRYQGSTTTSAFPALRCTTSSRSPATPEPADRRRPLRRRATSAPRSSLPTSCCATVSTPRSSRRSVPRAPSTPWRSAATTSSTRSKPVSCSTASR